MRALLATLLVGCASVPRGAHDEPARSVRAVIHGDTACTPVQRADCEASASDWGGVSHGHIDYRLVWDLSAQTLFALQDEPLLICRPVVERDGTSYCGMTTGTIVEVSTAPGCNVRGTSLHELGHLAGIHTHTAPGSVMHVSDDVRRLTVVDVQACAAIGLCPAPRKRDVTTVTVTVDPAIPPVDPDYPEWPHER